MIPKHNGRTFQGDEGWDKGLLRETVMADLARHGFCLLQDVEPSTSASILEVAGILGTLELGIDPELSGPPVMDLRYTPSKIKAGQRPAYFTADEFATHTDLAYVPNPPRFLLTHCVYPDPGGEGLTLLADCAAAFALVSEGSRTILAEPIFRFAYPPNCPLGETETLAVYRESRGGRLWRFRLDSMKFPERATQAVTEFRRALETVTITYALQRGELLIVDNHRAVHGRTEFGKSNSSLPNRHLRRAYAQEQN